MDTTTADESLMAFIREVQQRRAKNPPVAKTTWMEIFGTQPDDEASREAARLGEEWRRSEGRTD